MLQLLSSVKDLQLTPGNLHQKTITRALSAAHFLLPFSAIIMSKESCTSLMAIPERKTLPSQAGRQCKSLVSPGLSPFPANTLCVCERGGEGCNALIYQANDRGEGKGGGGERRGGRREEKNGAELEAGRREGGERGGESSMGGVSGTQKRRRNGGDDMKGGD